MTHDANGTHPPQRGRRWWLGGALAAAGVLGASGLLQASEIESFTTAARAESPAIRVSDLPPELQPPPAGSVAFPLSIEDLDPLFVADSFGMCRNGGTRPHLGIDISAPEGTPVYAVVAGELSHQYVATGSVGAGNGWTLEGDAGVDFKFFHLHSFAEGLAEGDVVEFGDVIGYVGETGAESNDPRWKNNHLHFEYYPDGMKPWDERESEYDTGATDVLPVLALPEGIQVGGRQKDCIDLVPG